MYWLKKIDKLLGKYNQNFDESELEYIEKYDKYVYNLHIEGLLESQRYKRWDPFNVRYGTSSVKGFYTELCGLVIWNENHNTTKLRLRADEQTEQRSGVDAVVTNPSWTNDYIVQIKPLYKADGWIRIYETYIQYDPKIVDRLILVDPKKMELYTFNYEEFLRHYSKAKQNYRRYDPEATYIQDKFYHLKHFDSFILT